MRSFCAVTALLAVLCLCMAGCAEPREPQAQATTMTTVITTAAHVVTTTEVPTSATVSTTATTAVSNTTAPVSGGASAVEPVVLDAAYQRLLLVNGENPLPDGFNTDALVSVPKQYCNGSLYQVDKDMYPYLMAMLKAAWGDGVQLYVRSPYRSYATQKMLFQNKVNTVIANGTPKDQAEAVAATAVARPGTSEHQTGLAIDFNVAGLSFLQLPAYEWMMQHGAEYGFILRYPENKIDITGVMYEPWHWRFVGINTAKEINASGLTLEEYVALKQGE